MDEIISTLIQYKQLDNVTNQYHDSWEFHDIARNNLKLYFEQMKVIKPKYLLVGEAPGYNGCRLTGVPFTSERIIIEKNALFDIFGLTNGYKVRNTDSPQAEPSAKIVWEIFNESRFVPLLWNAFPFHPYHKGDINSNRKPNANELKFGIEILQSIKNAFCIQEVIAIGNVAYSLLSKNGIACDKIRHPSMGGKRDFRNGVLSLTLRHRT